MTYIELILFETQVQTFIHFHVNVQLSVPAPFVEECFIHIELSWHPCQNSIDHKYGRIYLWIKSMPFICMTIFTPLPDCLDYYTFVLRFEIEGHVFSNPFSISGLLIQGLLHFCINFGINWSISEKRKKAAGIWIGIGLNV